jgi:hypothetical protein
MQLIEINMCVWECWRFGDTWTALFRFGAGTNSKPMSVRNNNLTILNGHQQCDHQSVFPQPVHQLRFEVAAECCAIDFLDLIVVGRFFFTNVEHFHIFANHLSHRQIPRQHVQDRARRTRSQRVDSRATNPDDRLYRPDSPKDASDNDPILRTTRWSLGVTLPCILYLTLPPRAIGEDYNLPFFA